jgi:thiamine-phosphate pyrophosphorylase
VQTIVVSPQSSHKEEVETIIALFEAGLDVYHIRKPKYSRARLEKYLTKFPEKYRDKMVIHTNHTLALKYKLKGIHLTRRHRKNEFITSLKIKYLKFFKSDLTISASFHKLANLYEESNEFDYVFLSPVFDSISKSGYQSGFNFHSLKAAMLNTQCKVVAIGGIELDKIDKIADLHFYGIALVGSIWMSPDPVKEFKLIKEKCRNREITA